MNGKLEKLQEKHTSTLKPKGRQPTSYPRTINLTDIHFTDEEQKLLDLGLQYSMQKPTKTAWENLVIETARAIKLLDGKSQNPFRIIAAKKLKQLHNTNHHNVTHKRQLHVLKQINRKITNSIAMITRNDKGKTTVIVYTHDYNEKSTNSFPTIISALSPRIPPAMATEQFRSHYSNVTESLTGSKSNP